MAKVAIVGCGAMGSVYAALMTSAGHAVHAVTLWADHAAAMRENGLRVEGASGDRTVRLASAGTTTAGIGPCDLVIIATKAFDVAAASTPAPILERLNGALNTALKHPEVAEKLNSQGFVPMGGTADDAREFVRKEHEKWGKIARDNRIRA